MPQTIQAEQPFRITPRMAVMATFAAFGAMVGTLAGSVPQLISQSGLTNASYGLGITIMTLATVASMGAAGALARRFSHRTLLLALMPFILAMLGLLLVGQSFWLFFPLAMLYGLGSGALDVIMNAEGGEVENDLKRPVYTAFHGSVSLSVAVFAIVSSLLSTMFGTWASLTAASLAVAAAMAMVHAAILPRTLAVPPANPSSQFSKPLILLGLAAGLIIACEVTALLWSSKLLAETAPGLAAISGLGAAFFGLCNALVRFPGDALRAHFGEIRLMSITIVFAIIGFAGLGMTDGFAASVFFFALTGMGLAVLCPCLFQMSSNQTPHNRAAGLSIAMLVAGLPRIVGPTAFGAVAEAYSTRLAFGACALVLLAALGVIRSLKV
ncbi:MAG: MFS transporter [Rhizobiaceae bacterium]